MHIQSRRSRDSKRLEDVLKDLRKLMLRIVDAPLRDPKLPQPEAKTLADAQPESKQPSDQPQPCPQ